MLNSSEEKMKMAFKEIGIYCASKIDLNFGKRTLSENEEQ